MRELNADDNKQVPQQHQPRPNNYMSSFASPPPLRQRSRSLTKNDNEGERDTLQHPQYQVKNRSPSQGRTSPNRPYHPPQPHLPPAEDPFSASLRDTAKLDIINLNQKRPLNHPSMQRQQDLVKHYGSKEDRSRGPQGYSSPRNAGQGFS